MKNITFKISGLHCSSCKTLVETEVGSLAGVKNISVSLEKGSGNVEFDENETNLDKIFQKIKESGYAPELPGHDQADKTSLKKSSPKKWLWIALFVLIFAGGYFLIRILGGWEIMSRLNDKNIGLGLVFLIGLLASFHCVGMCGGFIIAYSLRASKPMLHLQYNLGRLISYTVIGGILGGFGSFFGINPNFSGVVLLIAAIFMVLMGLKLAAEIKWLDKIKLRTPDFVARIIFKNRLANACQEKNFNTPRPKPSPVPPRRDHPSQGGDHTFQEGNKKGPFVIGLLTGFMPCGPLQAMQLYALFTGNWFSGASAMGVYALGTIPILFGFGNFVSSLTASRTKQLLKISGIIVIVLGLFTFSRAWHSFGLAKPAIEKNPAPAVSKSEQQNFQTVNMSVTYSGYQPNVIYIKKGVPVRWVIDGAGATGCTNAIILYNGAETIKKNLNQGKTVIEFTPAANFSEIRFSCWMKMVWGKFIVQ